MWDYGAHMGGMWIGWLLLLVLLVVAAWAVSRSASGGRERDSNRESPDTILKRRYARGDIDREEYERRLADLRK